MFNATKQLVRFYVSGGHVHMLRAGAEKISINSSRWESRPDSRRTAREIWKPMHRRVDRREKSSSADNGRLSNGGRKSTGWTPLSGQKGGFRSGAGERSCEQQLMPTEPKAGFDLELESTRPSANRVCPICRQRGAGKGKLDICLGVDSGQKLRRRPRRQPS